MYYSLWEMKSLKNEVSLIWNIWELRCVRYEASENGVSWIWSVGLSDVVDTNYLLGLPVDWCSRGEDFSNEHHWSSSRSPKSRVKCVKSHKNHHIDHIDHKFYAVVSLPVFWGVVEIGRLFYFLVQPNIHQLLAEYQIEDRSHPRWVKLTVSSSVFVIINQKFIRWITQCLTFT